MELKEIWRRMTIKTRLCFRYDEKTGDGFAPLSYDMFTDEVNVRLSVCGYVTGVTRMKTEEFFQHGEPLC